MKNETYELQPRTQRKSFYGKAMVAVNGNTRTLVSYGSEIIMRKDTKKGTYVKRVYDNELTKTTCCHLRSFIDIHKNQFENLELNKWVNVDNIK